MKNSFFLIATLIKVIRKLRFRFCKDEFAVFDGTLDCLFIINRRNISFQVIWYHDDRPVKESADFQLLFQGDRCSLVIHEAFLDDAGVYKVVAINTGGEASSECTLKITRQYSFIYKY